MCGRIKVRRRPHDRLGGMRSLHVGLGRKENVRDQPEMARRHHIRLGEAGKPQVLVKRIEMIDGMKIRRIRSIV